MVSSSMSFFETETPSPYSSFEKSIIERQCNMSRIELNIALMTISLAKEKRNVN
jgi:hypothetical protein